MNQDRQPEVRLYSFLQEIYGNQPSMTRIEVDIEALSGGAHGIPHLESTAVRIYAGSEQLLPDFEAVPYWKAVLAARPTLFGECTTHQDRLDTVQEFLRQEQLYERYGLDWPEINEKVSSPLCFTIEELRWRVGAGRGRKCERGGSMCIVIPAVIRKNVIHLLLDYQLDWFAFAQRTPTECILDVPARSYDQLLTEIASIRESGLEDDDDERSWFRYKGILISYVGDLTYWYRIWTSSMEEEKEFDVRDLENWNGQEDHIKHFIKAAIDSGELSPNAEFLRDRTDEE
jgi:hypothetical protein